MYVFSTTVFGVPCYCKVIHYSPYRPPKLHGHPDLWEPEEEGEFDYLLVDDTGAVLGELMDCLTSREDNELLEEFEVNLIEDSEL